MKQVNIFQISKSIDVDKYEESRKKYMKRMKNEGYYIYVPDDDELIIDIDTEDQWYLFLNRYDRLKTEFSSITYDEYESKSGYPHKHIIIKLPFKIKNHYERIALQAVLGSDIVKEMLSIFRAQNGDPIPSLLAMKEKL